MPRLNYFTEYKFMFPNRALISVGSFWFGVDAGCAGFKPINAVAVPWHRMKENIAFKSFAAC